MAIVRLRLEVLDDKRINLDQDWLDKYELEPYLLYTLIRLGYRRQRSAGD